MTDNAWMTADKAAQLRKPFEPAQIGRLPKGGTMLDYVGHAAATDRLLQVDPLWFWEPFATDATGLPALDAAGNLWIRLTICGVTRIGVGDGKTMKERIGDAIRNAAMRFGVALDLWAKEDLTPQPERQRPARQQQAGGQVSEFRSEAQSKKMFATAREAGISNDELRPFIDSIVGRQVESSKTLTKAEAGQVIEALELAIRDKANPVTGEINTDAQTAA